MDIDDQGNIFIADHYNHRIRKIDTNGTISTVAGNGTPGFSGDGGTATAASIRYPRHVVVNPEGGFYFTDHVNHRVRKVDGNGVITTYAGSGSTGFCGDGGPATNACLWYPDGVTLDSVGNLYICDGWNGRIRKVDANGTITTFAEVGCQGLDFDYLGNIYIAGYTVMQKVDMNGIVTRVGGTSGNCSYCGDGGPVGDACVCQLWCLGVDPDGNPVISDVGSSRIRAVDDNGIIDTIVGTGIAGFSGDSGPPLEADIRNTRGIAWDPQGNLYFASGPNNRIRKVTYATPGFSCVGFEPPMASGPVTVRANRALPLKAELFDTYDYAVTDLDLVAPPVVQVWFDPGNGSPPIDVTGDALPAGQGDDGNQFVFTGSQWQYNLKTSNYSAEGTYSITMAAGDNTEYLISPSCEAQFVIE